jgi:hypothetical protein
MKSFKSYLEEASFKVEVDGLPTMYVDADSAGKVKQNLRKLLKKADVINNIERIAPAEVKKAFRLKAAGKDEPESVEEASCQRKTEGQHGPEGEGDPYPDYADQFAKKKVRLSKHVDQDAKRAGLLQKEEVATTNTSGVDMNPTGKIKKQDGRSRFDVLRMYKRATGGV